jgi:hypothetical protein
LEGTVGFCPGHWSSRSEAAVRVTCHEVSVKHNRNGITSPRGGIFGIRDIKQGNICVKGRQKDFFKAAVF